MQYFNFSGLIKFWNKFNQKPRTDIIYHWVYDNVDLASCITMVIKVVGCQSRVVHPSSLRKSKRGVSPFPFPGRFLARKPLRSNVREHNRPAEVNMASVAFPEPPSRIVFVCGERYGDRRFF